MIHNLETVERMLAAMPFRLPSEAEWEYPPAPAPPR